MVLKTVIVTSGGSSIAISSHSIRGVASISSRCATGGANVASASVTALEFSQVWRIDGGTLESYINEYPRAAAWLLIGVGRTISHRLRAVNEKIAAFYSA